MPGHLTRAYAPVIVVKSPSREFALSLHQIDASAVQKLVMTGNSEANCSNEAIDPGNAPEFPWACGPPMGMKAAFLRPADSKTSYGATSDGV